MQRWVCCVAVTVAAFTIITCAWSAEDQASTIAVPVASTELRLIRAGEKLPLDLSTALRLATANNLEILEARARVREAGGEKTQALAAFLPVTSYSFTARKIDGRIQASFGELGDRTFSTLNPTGVLLLSVDPGKALFDTLAAHKLLDAATQQEESVTQHTLLTVAQQYFDLEQA